MLHHTYLEKIGLNQLIAWEPFSLSELHHFLATPSRYEDAALKSGPVLFDLRKVNVENIKMPDIRRQLIKKNQIRPDLSSFPCAYLVDGAEAFSIVSESFIYAKQIKGAASPAMFVTEDMTEAASWLSKFVGKNRFDIYRQLNAIYEPIEKTKPNV